MFVKNLRLVWIFKLLFFSRYCMTRIGSKGPFQSSLALSLSVKGHSSLPKGLSTLSFQFLWWYQFLFLGVQLHFQFSTSHRVIPNTDTKNLYDLRCSQSFLALILALAFQRHNEHCATITAHKCS
jgi:hypothetical protein